jgi:anti-anti-sigma factor
MAFNVTNKAEGNNAFITLSGELDAASAPQFKSAIETAATEHPANLVLMMQDLSYIASAGLRVLIFAKQKLGPQVSLYVIGAQPQVVDTLQKTGFDRSCIMQETYA